MSNSETKRYQRKAELMKGAVERRTLAEGSRLELREDRDEFIVSGYASTFEPAYPVGAIMERVAPTAFDRCLSELPDVAFNVDHGKSLSGLPLARTRSKKGGPGTLTLRTDENGLIYTAQLDRADPDAQALVRAIRSGRIWQSSFAFRCNNDIFDDLTNTRTLLDVSLHGGDVSAVANPANPATSVSARSGALAQRSVPIPSIETRYRERLALIRLDVPVRPARNTVRSDYYLDRLNDLRSR